VNMERRRSIVVDVTQLVHWSGKLAGIPRVMNELATRFARDPDTHFVVWVKELRELCEIDFLASMSQRGQGIVYLQNGKSGSLSVKANEATLNTVLARYRQRVARIAKAGARRTIRIHPTIFGPVERQARALALRSYKKVNLIPGDVLFIPWGEWWDAAFAARLNQYVAAGAKLVHVIHDIATTVQPQFFETVNVNPETYNAQVLPKAALVLAVSENTKNELTTWLKYNRLHVPPIKVIRNGDDICVAESRAPQEQAFKAANLHGKDFLLCVGTIEAKKNHALFYYVYKLAEFRGVRLPKLVMVGRRGWRTNDIYEIMTHDPAVASKFVFLHNIGDEELSWLYDHCLFTVQPSFHEGWGIPIAESLARGVPCLCSNTSSMIEIAEGIVGHFSPASADECLAAIQRWLNPRQLKQARDLAMKYQPTSWDATYNQVMSYIKEMV